MRLALCAAAIFSLFPLTVQAAGLARGEHFSVITPAIPTQKEADRYAALVRDRAEAFRKEFIKDWLNGDEPSTDVRTMISVSFSETDNSALTLARDNPAQKFHNVFLTSTAENASGEMLQHEIVHTVLATVYPHPNRLPPWAEEGIASRYDCDRLQGIRSQVARTWVRTSRAPSLAALLIESNFKSFDDTSYAAAESLVAFLLTRGDKQTLLQFADAGQRMGWDAALRSHYELNDVGELQRQWQVWLAKSL